MSSTDLGVIQFTNPNYEKLKSKLFMSGDDSIKEFLGYSYDITGLSRDEIEFLMDEVYTQMSTNTLVEFYKKYGIA